MAWTENQIGTNYSVPEVVGSPLSWDPDYERWYLLSQHLSSTGSAFKSGADPLSGTWLYRSVSFAMSASLSNKYVTRRAGKYELWRMPYSSGQTQIVYAIYDPATDAWETPLGIGSVVQSYSTGNGISGFERSNGQPIRFYAGMAESIKGTPYGRVNYLRLEGDTWIYDTPVDAGGTKHYNYVSAAIGQNDLGHFLWNNATDGLSEYRTLNGSNNLGTLYTSSNSNRGLAWGSISTGTTAWFLNRVSTSSISVLVAPSAGNAFPSINFYNIGEVAAATKAPYYDAENGRMLILVIGSSIFQILSFEPSTFTVVDDSEEGASYDSPTALSKRGSTLYAICRKVSDDRYYVRAMELSSALQAVATLSGSASLDAVAQRRLWSAVVESGALQDTATEVAVFRESVTESAAGQDAATEVAVFRESVTESAAGQDTATEVAVFRESVTESTQIDDIVALAAPLAASATLSGSATLEAAARQLVHLCTTAMGTGETTDITLSGGSEANTYEWVVEGARYRTTRLQHQFTSAGPHKIKVSCKNPASFTSSLDGMVQKLTSVPGLPQLTNLGGITLTDNRITYFDLSKLVNTDVNVSIGAAIGYGIDTIVTGGICTFWALIVNRYNGAALNLSANAVRSMQLYNGPNVTTLTLHPTSSALREVHLYDCPSIATINFPTDHHTFLELYANSLSAPIVTDFSAYTALKSLIIGWGNHGIITPPSSSPLEMLYFYFANQNGATIDLRPYKNTLNYVFLSNSSVGAINANETFAMNFIQFSVRSNPLVSSLDLSGIGTAGIVSVDGSTNLTTLVLPTTAVTSLIASSCPALQGLNISGVYSAMQNMNIRYSTAIPQAHIDQALAYLALNAQTIGTIDVRNTKHPSTSAKADVATIQASGRTVLYDTFAEYLSLLESAGLQDELLGRYSNQVGSAIWLLGSEIPVEGAYGPFVSSGGAFYILARAHGTQRVAVFKSAEMPGEGEWVEQDVSNAPASIAVLSASDVVQEGDLLHIAYLIRETGDSNKMKTRYVVFDMDTDSWGSPEFLYTSTASLGDQAESKRAISIYQRTGGDLFVTTNIG